MIGLKLNRRDISTGLKLGCEDKDEVKKEKKKKMQHH